MVQCLIKDCSLHRAFLFNIYFCLFFIIFSKLFIWSLTSKITSSLAKNPKDCKLSEKQTVVEWNRKITRKYHEWHFHTIRVTPKYFYLYKHFYEIPFLSLCAPISTSPFKHWNTCAFSSQGPICPSRFLADLHS